MSSLGEKYVAALVDAGDKLAVVSHGLIGEMFVNVEGDLYDYVLRHVKKHGVLPSRETLEEDHPEVLTTGLLPEVKEPSSYYLEKLRERYVEREIRALVNDIGPHLKKDSKDPLKALDMMTQAAFKMTFDKDEQTMAEYQGSTDWVIPEYVAKFKGGDEYDVKLGWPSLDEMTGGLRPGELTSIVGRPGRGKSWLSMYSALHVWDTYGLPVLFVSMEMDTLTVMQRMASMTTHIPISHIMQTHGHGLTTKEYKRLKKELNALKKRETGLTIIDGNFTSTVADIVMMASHLDVKAVFVDGAYLLKHPRSMGRYERVAENCDLLKKDLATGVGVPVIATWQFSREAAKKVKKGQTPDLEDIGYSDAIGQHSGLVLGLMEDESVETLVRRRMDVLKGRSGQKNHFYVGWDFVRMDFTERPTETLGKIANL